METTIKEINFKKNLPIGFEIKDLSFVKEFPLYFNGPRKATFYQIIWLTEGEARFQIDFRNITVKANEAFVISTNQVYCFDTASCYQGKMILFTDSFFMQTDLDSDFLHTSEILNPVNLNAVVAVDNKFMSRIIGLLDTELKNETDLFQMTIARSYLRVILLTLERVVSVSASPVSVQLDMHLGRRFCNEVEKHFKESRETIYYLNLLGVGEKTLSREVKQLTGKTPKAYIDSRIILEAKRLLTYSSSAVKEIGYELGFDESTNFNKFFRKHTSMTPVSFRKSVVK